MNNFNQFFEFFTKNKRIFVATVIMLSVVLGSSIVYAVTVFTTTQTLTTPEPEPEPSIIVYVDENLTVELVDGEDATQYWVWNSAELRFELDLYIYNNEATSITPTFAVGDVSGWSLTQTNPNIAPSNAGVATITMKPITYNGGETAAFTLSINI